MLHCSVIVACDAQVETGAFLRQARRISRTHACVCRFLRPSSSIARQALVCVPGASTVSGPCSTILERLRAKANGRLMASRLRNDFGRGRTGQGRLRPDPTGVSSRTGASGGVAAPGSGRAGGSPGGGHRTVSFRGCGREPYRNGLLVLPQDSRIAHSPHAPPMHPHSFCLARLPPGRSTPVRFRPPAVPFHHPQVCQGKVNKPFRCRRGSGRDKPNLNQLPLTNPFDGPCDPGNLCAARQAGRGGGRGRGKSGAGKARDRTGLRAPCGAPNRTRKSAEIKV